MISLLFTPTVIVRSMRLPKLKKIEGLLISKTEQMLASSLFPTMSPLDVLVRNRYASTSKTVFTEALCEHDVIVTLANFVDPQEQSETEEGGQRFASPPFDVRNDCAPPPSLEKTVAQVFMLYLKDEGVTQRGNWYFHGNA